MRNFSFIIFLFAAVFAFSQNTEIKNATGAIIPSPYYYCAGEVLNLQVDDFASTGSSGIGSVPTSGFSSIINDTTNERDVVFNAASVVTDKFSYPIDLDFNFKFFNKTYTKIVVGSNGRVVLTNDPLINSLNDTTTYIDRTFFNPPSVLPSVNYNRVYKTGDVTREIKMAQIFAGFTRLKISGGAYKQKKFDVGGNKGILITFQNVFHYDGSGSAVGSPFTSRIILFDDGRIVLNYTGKTSGFYNAILGLQNEDGTKEMVADTKFNNGEWFSDSNSNSNSYVFTTDANKTPTYLWELDRNGDGTPDETATTRFFPNYTPVSDIEKLNLKITFLENTDIVLSDVEFRKLKTPQISAPDYSLGCGSPARIQVLSPDPGLIYDWYSETDASFHQTGTSILVGNGSYYVQVKGSNGACILKSTSEVVNISSVLPPFLFDAVNIKLCDNLDSLSEVFNLATVTNYPLDPSKYSVQFFENGSSTPITASTLNSGQTKNFTITVSTNSGITPVCTFTKSFSVSYLSFPPNNNIYTSANLCLSSTSYTVADFKTSFFAGSNFQFQFSDGVNFNLNSVNPQTSSSVWIQITEPNFTCQSIVKLNFNFHPSTTANAPITQLPPQCSSSFSPFNLTSLVPEINPGNVTITFHNSPAGAQSGGDVFLNDNSIGSKTVYIRVVDNVTGCVSVNHPTITLLVYAKPTIISPNPITQSQCPGTNFNLTQNPATLTNAAAPVMVTLEYYSANGTQLFGSDITNFNASVPVQNPYIKVIYNATCSDIIPFNLTYLPKPLALTNQIPICAETTYPLQEFKNQVATNPAQYTFTDVSGGPLPEYFDLSGSTLPTVNFLMKDNTTGCVSDPQSVSFVKRTNSVLLVPETDYTLCDEDFDGKTEFNLQSKESDFTGSPATFEYFKDALFDQKIEDFTKYVNENPFDETIYVKITISGFCPSIGKIHLKVNMPTTIQFLGNTDLCFQENLSFSISNLSDFNSVKLIAPDGTETAITTDHTINYADVQFGKIYKIKAENTLGCISEISFTPSDENQPKIDLINQTNNSIEVIASGGTKPYRYYFNGILNPSGHILQNPTQSSYEIQVESATGCFGPPKTIYFIKINNAFTPNGDGINDTWKIDNLDKMQEVSIVIINRNGTKVFESTNPSKSEWDGKSNGRELPTSSYWYVVTWFDAVTQKAEQRQGWILLKNRN